MTADEAQATPESNAPKIIYLQDGGGDEPLPRDLYDEQVTWCESSIENDDTKYIRFDEHERRLAAAQRELGRWHDQFAGSLREDGLIQAKPFVRRELLEAAEAQCAALKRERDELSASLERLEADFEVQCEARRIIEANAEEHLLASLQEKKRADLAEAERDNALQAMDEHFARYNAAEESGARLLKEYNTMVESLTRANEAARIDRELADNATKALLAAAENTLRTEAELSALKREVERLGRDGERLDYLEKVAVIAKPGQTVRAAIDAARAAMGGGKNG